MMGSADPASRCADPGDDVEIDGPAVLTGGFPMMKPFGARRLLVAAPLLAVFTALAGFGQEGLETGPPPSRILVAPVVIADGAESGALGRAVPALFAEAISGGRAYTASLVADLAPDTLEEIGRKGTDLTAAALTDPNLTTPLRESGSIRVILFPRIERTAAGAAPLRLVVAWRDLESGRQGSASAEAADAPGLIDAVGNSAADVQKDLSASFKPDCPVTAPPPPLSESMSRSGTAIEAWARAAESWRQGDPQAAETALQQALREDPGFGGAKVDLAWIRLAQGRAADAAALDALAGRLRAEAPASPWGSLAEALARDLGGEHERAVSLLDPIRLHRPNDPAIIYEAGVAALGAGDVYEALTHLERAASLWPAHDRIQLDLAEARLRNHDLDGAEKALEAWRARYAPGRSPIWGGSWSISDPPPTVRAVEVDLIKGSYAKAIEKLEKEDSALASAGAPAADRVPVLLWLHEIQRQLAFGDPLVRQRWMEAQRSSLGRLREVMPPADQQARPWVLRRLEALLRVAEGRIPEAREIRAEILAASSLPGYDPVAEIEIEQAIALKTGDPNGQAEATLRAARVGGEIRDIYRYAQTFAFAAKGKELEQQYQILVGRIEVWSSTRRRDAMLWSPETSLLVPYIYSMGAVSGYIRGDADASRHRYSIMLAYFRAPDEAVSHMAIEGLARGAKPAW